MSTFLPLPASTTSHGRTPGPPSSSGGHPPGGILPTDGQTTSPSDVGQASGGVQPSVIQPPTDSQTPLPDLSGSHPPSPIPTGQPPAPPSGRFPPGGHLPFTFSTDGQNLGPPSGEFPPGSHPLTGQPPAPRWGGLPPGVSPPAPITDIQPPSPIPTDGQPPGPPSFTSGGGAATSSPTSLVTTDSFPSGPDPDSFLISSLRRKCSPDEAPTDGKQSYTR